MNDRENRPKDWNNMFNDQAQERIIVIKVKYVKFFVLLVILALIVKVVLS